MPRSPLLHGLALTLRHPRPLLWTFAFNAGIAWVTSLGLRTQFANVMATSLGAQRMIGGFDLGVMIDATRRLQEAPPGGLTVPGLGTPIYLLLFFLLVPGTLLTYQMGDTGRKHPLGVLLQTGLQSFWSFVRIVLLTMIVSGVILGVLGALQYAWSNRVDRTMTGGPALLLELAGMVVILLVACLLRLYFDLVEVHAMALAQNLRPTGRPDRRIRTTLRPALRTLRRHFLPSYLMFTVLTLLGAAAAFLGTRSAFLRLAQPRSWPMVLVAELGIFVLLFTRFWQRAAETVLFQNVNPLLVRSTMFVPLDQRTNPAPPPPLEPPMTPYASTFPTPDPIYSPLSPNLPGPDSNPMPIPPTSPTPDPLPGPEPIAPSLASPDTGVFHHEPAVPGDHPAKDRDLLN